MRKYIVSTHIGDFPTMASSSQKAVANIRCRIAAGEPYAMPDSSEWIVREVA